MLWLLGKIPTIIKWHKVIVSPLHTQKILKNKTIKFYTRNYKENSVIGMYNFIKLLIILQGFL